MSNVLHVNELEFKELIKENNVFVDFYADWCGPCKMLGPSIEKLADAHPEIKVVKINTDEETSLAISYGVQSIPALFFIKDGEVASQQLGFVPYNTLEEMIK